MPRLNPTTSSAPQVDVLKGHPSPESSRWPTPRIVIFPAAPHSNPKTKKANQCDSMPPSSPHVSCTSHLSPTSARKPSPSKPQQKKHCNNPTLRRGGWHHSPPALRQPRRCSGHMRLPWLHGSRLADNFNGDFRFFEAFGGGDLSSKASKCRCSRDPYLIRMISFPNEIIIKLSKSMKYSGNKFPSNMLYHIRIIDYSHLQFLLIAIMTDILRVVFYY